MGYTHYFETEKTTSFPQDFVENVRKIVKTSKVSIRGGLGEGKPEITAEKIRFNGDSKNDEDYETFAMNASDNGMNFCKTAELPYDEVVTAVLASAAHHGIAKIKSDGNLADWEAGLDLLKRATGINARETVAQALTREA